MEDLDVADLIARYYDPTRWAVGRSWLKLGPLTLYIYSHGIGWAYRCGVGHELRWRKF